MKKNLLLLFFTLLSVIVTAQPYTVQTINGAVYKKNYNAGDTVHILANPRTSGFVFNKWIGNTVALVDTYSYHTTFVMPAVNQILTATYTAATAWSATNEVLLGTQTYRYFPPVTKGLILFFHGAGGNANGWTEKNQESRLFCEQAAAAGYAIFASESKNRMQKKWDPNPTGADIPLIRSMLDTLIGRGYMTNTTPLFGIGMSEGGGILSVISTLDTFKAQGIYCNEGIAQVMNITKIPTTFVHQRWDTLGTQGVFKLDSVTKTYNNLLSRSIPARLDINYPSPIFKTRFWRIPTIDSVKSNQIYQYFKTGGYLSNTDFLIIDPRNATNGSAWKAGVPAAFTANIPDVEDQLYTCFTEHKFTNDMTHKTIKFFDLFVGSPPIVIVPVAPALVSPANGAINVPSPTIFKWNSVANADSFQIEVSTSSTFANNVQTKMVSTNTATYTLPQITNLLHWHVRAKNIAGYSAWSPTWNFKLLVTKLNEINSLSNLFISPNPASDWIEIKIQDDTDISILDILGKPILSQKISQTDNRVNITLLPKGLYFIALRQNSEFAIKPFLKD